MILFSIGFAAKFYGICINVTPSIPEGIYRKDNGKIHRGDVVAFCLVEPYQTIGLKQRYVEKGTVCHGTSPLIKQVIPIPGDEVRLTDSSIAVNAIIYPYQPRYTDSQHRKLAVYPRGTYHAQGYWLVGTHSPHSWDSRYFGEVSTKQILYKLIRIILW
jgi:conjugative transfer signal peptidase TraF